MDTQGSVQIAAELGISLPRLHRVVLGHQGVSYDARKRMRLDASAVDHLRNCVGVIPKVSGLTRTETQVLTALSRHSRGLVSIRQVATASGVSPTSASRSVVHLESVGLVRQEKVFLFDGEVIEREVYVVTWCSQSWLSVAPIIAKAILPKRPPSATAKRLPSRLASTFWTGNWRSIDPRTDAKAVAERILDEGRYDAEAISYLGELPTEALRKTLEHKRYTRTLASSVIATEKHD